MKLVISQLGQYVLSKFCYLQSLSLSLPIYHSLPLPVLFPSWVLHFLFSFYSINQSTFNVLYPYHWHDFQDWKRVMERFVDLRTRRSKGVKINRKKHRVENDEQDIQFTRILTLLFQHLVCARYSTVSLILEESMKRIHISGVLPIPQFHFHFWCTFVV